MAGAITKGRRREDGTHPDDLKPGDYCKRGPRWWVCLPDGNIGALDARWAFTEHEDGTLTVGPGTPGGGSSIKDPGGWHGHLKRGVWTTAA